MKVISEKKLRDRIFAAAEPKRKKPRQRDRDRQRAKRNNAGPVLHLLGILRSEDPAARAGATRGLRWHLQNAEVVAALTAVEQGDANEEVRAEAHDALRFNPREEPFRFGGPGA